MKEKFRRFMQGRYGTDELGNALLVAVVICFVLSWFLSGVVKSGVNFIGWGILVYSYFRIFSKNYTKRWAENQKFLSFKNRILGEVNRQKSYAKQRKTHRIYSCPGCKQKIRVPKGKGKIEISCPKCRTKFVKKS